MSNATPDIPGTPRRRNKVLILGGLLFGAVCFLAGRFTVQLNSSRDASASAEAPASTVSPANAAVRPEKAPGTEARGPGAGAPSGWDDRQWQQALARPGSPARSHALEDLIEKLGASDPDRAMSMARAEGNLKLRDTLVQAALRGWARTSPTNAANWALALSDSNERERALATVFAGAVATDPEEAVRFGKSLLEKNPDDAPGYGSSLIGALCDAGNFEIAVRMAGGGSRNNRSGWMSLAWSRWAEFQPDQAAHAAQAISDPDLRNEALHGIVGGWGEADPAALVQFVTQLPADTDRGSILSQSLERWVRHDPEAASRWINNRDPGADMDQGVAAVATMDSVPPDTAVSWAESVLDPKLRSETLVTVIRNWLTVDMTAARHYFDTTKNLLPDDRKELGEVFTNFSNDAARQ